MKTGATAVMACHR